MTKLKVDTSKIVEESHGLINVFSNQTDKMKSFKERILKIIEEAKKIDKRKKVDNLRQFVEGYTKEIHTTNPGKLSLDNINATTETAYQRKIFSSVKTNLNTIGEVLWIDMELPVVFKKSRRRKCVDLIGILNDNTSVLCELKLASEKNRSDSPIYAVIELLIYYYLIQENYKELDEQNVFHEDKRVKEFKWEHINHSTVFIIGANDMYWNHWKKRYEKQKNDIELWKNLLPHFKIQFLSSGKFDLKQEVQSESKPNITEWHEVYF